MIELKIEGCCQGCEYIDLDLVSLGELNFVLCKHQSVCGKLEEESKKGADVAASYKEDGTEGR